MFKWYKSGIFEKVIPQIHSGGKDLRSSGIVGIHTHLNTFDCKSFYKGNHTNRLERQI